MKHTSECFGILGVLQAILIFLKRTGFIDWTMWQILIPTFICIGCAAVAILMLTAIVIIDQYKYHSNR